MGMIIANWEASKSTAKGLRACLNSSLNGLCAFHDRSRKLLAFSSGWSGHVMKLTSILTTCSYAGNSRAQILAYPLNWKK
jgi:hypothetical protein